MTTLEDVRAMAERARSGALTVDETRRGRDLTIRACYYAGNGNLKELAEAAKLTKQRISQIVLDGRE
jgi:hypothetical protein